MPEHPRADRAARAELPALDDVMAEVRAAVEQARRSQSGTDDIKGLRCLFDQVSAKMNQSIYNDQRGQIHASCLETVAVLIEILARTHS